MYQGKFNSNNKGGSNIHDIIAQRSAAGPQPSRPAPQRQSQNPQSRQPQQQPYQQPYQQPPVQEAPRRRGPRIGGVIFYTIYFLFIFLFFVGVFQVLQFLRDFLVTYEAAQPDYKCEEVFQQNFADPDWGALYDLAGVEDTAYEGKEAFVAYMENKVGSQELTYMETSAGLSGNKKYIVRLGSEKIATFTLEGDPGATITDIPDWRPGSIELFYERNESYRVQKMDGHTAYVNGVALTDDHTIQIATTLAEEYLPMGLSGVRTCVQEFGGLMTMPTVTVVDDKGSPMDVTYDEETRTFVEQTVSNTISEDEQTVALKAVQTYALFMIEKSTAAEVAKYFDSSTPTYTTIVRSEIWWTQANNGAAFSQEKVSGYSRYSDTLFSVRVSMSLDVTRKDGTLKKFPVDTTLFFEKQGNKWMVIEMTNVDVNQPVGQVRLTFKNGDEILTTGFVNTDASSVNTPVISAPEGKRFAGWVRESLDENGVKTLTIMFGPTENGVVALPAGTVLEPMTLYAHFEDIEG